MDGQERAAAAHATGGAVARVTRAVAGTHEVLINAVRTGLTPLGPIGSMPFEAAALMARFNFAAVQAVARGVGTVAAPLLEASAAPDARPAHDHPPAVVWLAALGGAFGDRLVDDHRVRALAVPMSLRDRGALVELGPGWDDHTSRARTSLDHTSRVRTSLARTSRVGTSVAGTSVAHASVARTSVDHSSTVVVFVHGLGNHELMWGQSYLDVARTHGACPLTVRYTTGQAIADSGAELGELLDRLVVAWPVPIQRIVLVGHSMGGLVIREALAAAGSWGGLVSDVITLGTPHSGAPLERAAVRGLALASSLPVVAPLAALGDERSTGIKNLGIAAVAPATAGPDWHLVAATLGRSDPVGVVGRARSGMLGPLGDGMVSVASAFAVDEHLTARCTVIDDASHMALLDHPEAADVLRLVLATA